MELRQLRYFAVIVEEANFTRAAEKVFVSQSALSQQIQVLEQELGTILLNRSKRGVSLTPAGAILYRHVGQILRELEQAQTAIQELEDLQRGDLRIGVVQTVNDYLMPRLASAFAGQHPHIKLQIEELSADAIEQGLEQGELDVGLGFVPGANPQIATRYLFDEQLVLIVRADHPLAQQSAVAVAALDQLPMVMLSNTFCTRRLWEATARLAPAQPHITIEMNTVSSILAVVEKTGLATVLPQLTLDQRLDQRLVAVRLIDPTPARQVGVLWSQQHYQCRAAQAFIVLVQAQHLQPAHLAAPSPT